MPDRRKRERKILFLGRDRRARPRPTDSTLKRIEDLTYSVLRKYEVSGNKA